MILQTSGSEAVKVFVRARPGTAKVAIVDKERSTIGLRSKDKRLGAKEYDFEAVFPEDITQAEVSTSPRDCVVSRSLPSSLNARTKPCTL